VEEDQKRSLWQRIRNEVRARPIAYSVLAVFMVAGPGVTSVIFGARTPEQVAANVEAEKITLDDATLTALNNATSELKTALGPNADLWNSETRIT